MRADYALKIGEMTEAALVKGINKNLNRMKELLGDPRVKNPKLKKREAHGVSDPDGKNFSYDYQYNLQDRYMQVFAQLYPNINSEGEIKFDVEGAAWNIYVYDFREYDVTFPLIEELLLGMPVEYVLIKEYVKDENRL